MRSYTFIRIALSKLLFLIGLTVLSVARAQVWGVVWQPPRDTLRALQEWQRLRHLGAMALRLDTPSPPAFLLRAADTLGIVVLVELPVADEPARQLLRRLPALQKQLRTLLQQVAGHTSVRAIGLARLVDTADPDACVYFETLRAEVQRVRPDLQVYYETRFIEGDRCGTAVDFVLLDVRDVEDPLQPLQRWQQVHPTVTVGIGRLGTWVRADTLRGLRRPHSPEWQARYLERHLRQLRDVFSGFVFVYRWQDITRSHPALYLDTPFVETYGLHNLQGERRPAFEVVRGFFTGAQTVFAFPAGRPSGTSGSGVVLIGWIPIVLLVLSYRFSLPFRLLGTRYFRAHGFYIEAVQYGRDLPAGALGTLALAEGIALGVILTAMAQMLRESLVATWLIGRLPSVVAQTVVESMQTPALLLSVVALSSLGGLGCWAGGLMLLSRWGHRVGFVQAWTLAHMPRWPLLGLMIGALSLLPDAEGDTGHRLLILWVLTEAWGLFRTVRDAGQVVEGPAWIYPVLALLHPSCWLLLAALGGLGWGLYTGHTIFLWHLLMVR
ncbi:MAG: hypothetical protein Q9M35_09080 [Rhodothermus sp.]|nr:hypothetical protein [Rhodothermus sp.]